MCLRPFCSSPVISFPHPTCLPPVVSDSSSITFLLNITPPFLHLDPLFLFHPFLTFLSSGFVTLSSRVTGYLTLNSGQQADHRSSLCHCSCSSCGCSRRHHSRAGGTRYHGGSPRACHPSHPAPCLHLSLTLWTSSSSVFPLLNLLCYPSLLSEHGSSEHDGWQHC